jgi:hypothetical protein
MDSINRKVIEELSSHGHAPCISLFMPTHQSHPENLQDPVNYKNLIKQIEVSLLKKYSDDEVIKFLEPLRSLINDKAFWNHVTPGLVIFSSAGIFKIIGLPQSIEKLAIVANSFHTKPLSQYIQTADRYQVLGLSLDRIQLFEGNRHSFSEIALPDDMPKTLTEVLGKELSGKNSTVASYGGVGNGKKDMHHGDGGIKDQIDTDTEKFFRFISKEIFEKFSKPSGLPLILAALPEHHFTFKAVSKNTFLLKEGITKNPANISLPDLAKLTWEVMEPIYILKIKNLTEQFWQGKANNMGSDDLEITAAAAAAGKVATLLIEAGRIIPGKITDNNTGSIEKGSLMNPEIDDLLDDIASLAAKMGAEVIVIPGHDMPSKTGIAATFRY